MSTAVMKMFKFKEIGQIKQILVQKYGLFKTPQKASKQQDAQTIRRKKYEQSSSKTSELSFKK